MDELLAWRCIDSDSAHSESAASAAVAARRAQYPTLYGAVDKLHTFYRPRSLYIQQKGLLQTSNDFINTPPRDSTQQLSSTDVIAFERLLRGEVADAVLREMAAWNVVSVQHCNGYVVHLNVLTVLSQYSLIVGLRAKFIERL